MAETRYYYAEINSENICFNVIDSGVEITSDNLIAASSYDTSLLGKKYSNGTWENVTSTQEPTDSELFQANTLLNQADILSNQNNIDATLAQILLNQIGG